MSWNDDALADHLEQLLDVASAAKLEAALAEDPALAARSQELAALLESPVTLPAIPLPEALAARVQGEVGAQLDRLDAILREPVTLPPLTIPPGLTERVLTALEEAGLCFDPAALEDEDEDQDGLAAAPAGLLDATLGRLESEGLVAAATASSKSTAKGPTAATRSNGAFQLLPGGPRPGAVNWRRLAAALLVGLGLGLTTHALRSSSPAAAGDPGTLASLQEKLTRADEARRAAERASRDLRGDVDRLREEAGSLRESRRQATKTSTGLAAAVARLTREARTARDATARLQGERGSLVKRAARVAVLEQEVARLQARPKTAPPRNEERVTQLERQLAKLGKELEADRKKLHALDAARRRRRGAASLMEITSAQRIEVWVGGSWVPIRGKRRLEEGTILRGHGATNALLVGVRPYRLRDGALYRVKGARRLELLPTTDDLTSGAGESPAERMPDLIRQLASGTPGRRARAYEALVELYWFYRDLDPGLGVVRFNNVAAVARGRLGEIAGEEGPPALDEAKWWAWWSRIKSNLDKQ